MAYFFKVNVSVAVFNTDAEILLQKRSMDEDVFPGLWGIPGGTLEMTDASLADCLRREVREEVGIEIDNITLVQENVKAKEMYGVAYLVYRADYVSGTPTALDGTEIVQWTKIQDIESLDFTPTTKETLLVISNEK